MTTTYSALDSMPEDEFQDVQDETRETFGHDEPPVR